VERARNIEEKYDETSRTSTFLPIRYTDASRHGGRGKYNSFRRAVSLFAGRKLVVSRERDRDILRASATSPRTLDSAYLYRWRIVVDLVPSYFSLLSYREYYDAGGAGEYTGDGYACNERAINASLDAISHVYFQFIRISLSNMKEVSRHYK